MYFISAARQHEEINGLVLRLEKTRTGYDVSGMEVSARVRVWADALYVAPTVSAFAADGTLRVNNNVNCGLVRYTRLVATERRRAGRRATRRAIQRWDPSQLGIMNAIPCPSKSLITIKNA